MELTAIKKYDIDGNVISHQLNTPTEPLRAVVRLAPLDGKARIFKLLQNQAIQLRHNRVENRFGILNPRFYKLVLISGFGGFFEDKGFCVFMANPPGLPMGVMDLILHLGQAAFGLAKTSSPRPVSRKDFRLESTVGQPLLMPLAIPLSASSSLWVTVSRTISSYSSISNVTRL